MDGIKTYTLKDLASKEKIDKRTVKARYKYIPVKIENALTRAGLKSGNNKKGYSVKYIILDDVLKLLKDEVEFTFIRKKTK